MINKFRGYLSSDQNEASLLRLGHRAPLPLSNSYAFVFTVDPIRILIDRSSTELSSPNGQLPLPLSPVFSTILSDDAAGALRTDH